MRTATKISLGVTAVTVAGLCALAAPTLVPTLARVVPGMQQATGPTLDTVPVSVDEMFVQTGLDDFDRRHMTVVKHADVDDEYELAASIWPWELPAGWKFPADRGVADTPGTHWEGMGVRAAFSTWAIAALDAVEHDGLTAREANRMLDEVEDATLVLLDLGVLTDRSFIADAVTPLRPAS